MRNKFRIGLIVVTMLLVLIPVSIVVYAQNPKSEKAAAFLATAQESKEYVEDLMAFLGTEGIDVPDDATAYYNAGSDLLTQASDAFDLEDYSEAFQLAKDAFWNFRKAIKILNQALEPIEPQISAENDHSALGEAINRADERRQRLIDIIDAIDTAYSDIDTTNGILSALKDILGGEVVTLLGQAETLLASDPPDVAGAAGKLGDAKRMLSEIHVSIKSHVSGALNSGKIKGFLTKMRNFHRTLSKKVDRLEDGSFKTEQLDTLADALNSIDAADPEQTQGVLFEESIAHLMHARSLLEEVEDALWASKKGGGST